MSEIEKAIKTINSIYEDYLLAEDDRVDLRPYDEDVQEIDTILRKALQEKAEREKNPNGWIPVSEKWPNKSGHYITAYREWTDGEYFPVYDEIRVKILRYHDAVFILPKCLDDEAEQDIHREVIAWQPLPEPYKGE